MFVETKIARSADAGGDAVLRTYFCWHCMEHVGSCLFGEEEGKDVRGEEYRVEKFKEGDH